MNSEDTELTKQRKRILQELEEEYDGFSETISRLDHFVHSLEFDDLTIDEQTLAESQLEAGVEYHDILMTRIRDTRMRLEPEVKEGPQP